MSVVRLSCPRCASALAVRAHGDVALGPCFSCGGMWLSADAARTVEAALRDDAGTAASAASARATAPFPERQRGGAALPCPTCRTDMQRFVVGPVEVDHCGAHGTWYDRGELVVVQEHLAAQTKQPVDDGGDSGLELARAPTSKSARREPSERDERRQEIMRGMAVAEKSWRRRVSFTRSDEPGAWDRYLLDDLWPLPDFPWDFD